MTDRLLHTAQGLAYSLLKSSWDWSLLAAAFAALGDANRAGMYAKDAYHAGRMYLNINAHGRRMARVYLK